MREARTISKTLLLCVALSGGSELYAQAGSVSGTVFDSIAGAPLAGASIFLWQTPFQATTDDDGRFRIGEVPVGEYDVHFFHERLGTLGVSPGPRRVSVERGQDAVVRLGTPSMSTVVSSQCSVEERPEHAGAIAGQVTDGQSEVPLSGAHVTLSWHEADSPVPRSLELQTGSDGYYRTCAAPSDVPLLISAGFYGREGPRHEIVVEEDGFVEDELPLFQLRPSDVTGRLVDRQTEESVEGAETWLRGTHYRTLTDRAGHFAFDDVPPGTYMLMTDHLVYGTKMDTLEVPAGQTLTVEMLLDDRPIEIAPITVTAESPPVTIDRRRGGTVITSAEIDRVRQRSRDAADIIRSLNIPGVIVRHTSSSGRICVGFSAGQVKMNHNGCVGMVVFINDVRATDASAAAHISPNAIERMVVYKPLEAGNLFGLGGGNGVWMIYTRGN